VVATVLPLLQPIVVLAVGALLIPLIELLARKAKVGKLRDALAVIFFAVALYSVLPVYDAVAEAGGRASFVAGGVTFAVDVFSVFMALVFCTLGFLVAVYSVKYMEEDNGLDRYYSLLMTLTLGMMGVVFAGDLFTLFIFWELMCVSSYALVSFRKYRWEPIEATFKYLIMSTIGSLTALYAMSFLYGLTGTLNIADVARTVAQVSDPQPLYLLIVAMIAGFGVTASIVPFHAWLPDAHPAAPSGISALLSGVVIKAGVYAIARVLFAVFDPKIFDFGSILILFGIITLTVANVMALLQRDLKRLLAFSSIVNIGYIVFGFGVGAYAITAYGDYGVAVMGVMGAVFHILNHALGKGLLFLGAGSFAHGAGTRDIAELEGVGKRMPITGTTFSIGLLTLAGVPPMSGFWSKLFIILAGLARPNDPFMVSMTVLVVLNSVFAAAYYVWLMQRLMLKSKTPKAEGAKESPMLMLVPIVVLCVLTVVLGVYPLGIMRFADAAARSLLGLIGG